MGRIDGKVAIVTGAAGGIGSAVARLFVDEGARVVVTDIDGEGATEVADAIGSAAVAQRLDVSLAADWRSAMATIEATFHRLDILVNCAGLFRPAPLEVAAEADLRRMFEVNQLGTFLGLQHAVGPMRDGGGGSIVNVSSGAGLAGMPSLSGYASTKFAIRGLTRCAAMELGIYGIRVNSIHPGGIDTPMVARTDESAWAYGALPVPRIGRPDEIAQAALYLASDESSYCTGSELVADGGMAAGFRLAAMGSAGR